MKIEMPLMVPSITPFCSEVIISGRPIGTAVAPRAAMRARSAGVALTRNFSPLKSSMLRNGFLAPK